MIRWNRNKPFKKLNENRIDKWFRTKFKMPKIDVKIN